VCIRHKGEACILKTKFPVIAYTENKWLIMFLRTFRRRRPPTAEMAKDKRSEDPALARFYEVMARTNVEKITDEILAGLSGDSSDSEDFDIEGDNDDAEDRPWRPSHVVFEKRHC
jgi:hypothetical protein